MGSVDQILQSKPPLNPRFSFLTTLFYFYQVFLFLKAGTENAHGIERHQSQLTWVLLSMPDLWLFLTGFQVYTSFGLSMQLMIALNLWSSFLLLPALRLQGCNTPSARPGLETEAMASCILSICPTSWATSSAPSSKISMFLSKHWPCYHKSRCTFKEHIWLDIAILINLFALELEFPAPSFSSSFVMCKWWANESRKDGPHWHPGACSRFPCPQVSDGKNTTVFLFPPCSQGDGPGNLRSAQSTSLHNFSMEKVVLWEHEDQGSLVFRKWSFLVTKSLKVNANIYMVVLTLCFSLSLRCEPDSIHISSMSHQGRRDLSHSILFETVSHVTQVHLTFTR